MKTEQEPQTTGLPLEDEEPIAWQSRSPHKRNTRSERGEPFLDEGVHAGTRVFVQVRHDRAIDPHLPLLHSSLYCPSITTSTPNVHMDPKGAGSQI
jgi:hypothetical protein